MTEGSLGKDGGWSVVVAIASFGAQIMLGGYVYTAGMFYTIFTDQFPDVSTVAVSWLCALPLTLWFIGGPLGSVIINRHGNRACSLLGGALGATGLCLCYFATHFYIVFFCYGVVAGMGYGIQFVGFVNAVSQYFDKYRTVVTILTTAGPTLGLAIYSFLVPYLIDLYTWRGALLILGGITLNLWICAVVLFPIQTQTQQRRKRTFKFSILKKKYFACMCIQCFALSISIALVILHLPSLVQSLNLGASNASVALTTYGVANCLAKVFYGVIGQLTNADVCVVYTFSLLLCGIAIALVPIVSSLQWILTLVGLVGFTFCVAGGHSLMVVLDLVGQEYFSDGVGINQMFRAVGTLSAGPLAGFLYSISRSYEVSFYCGGLLMVGGCTLMVPVLVNKWKNRGQQTHKTRDPVPLTHNEECLRQALVISDRSDGEAC